MVKESVFCPACFVNDKYKLMDVEPVNHLYESKNTEDVNTFEPVQVQEGIKSIKTIVTVRMMKHLEKCDEDAFNAMVRERDVEEKKPDVIGAAPVVVAKKTTFKNTKDVRPAFSMKMGFSKFRSALNHLKLVMEKTLTKWSENDDEDEDAKLARQFEWFWSCINP